METRDYDRAEVLEQAAGLPFTFGFIIIAWVVASVVAPKLNGWI